MLFSADLPQGKRQLFEVCASLQGTFQWSSRNAVSFHNFGGIKYVTYLKYYQRIRTLARLNDFYVPQNEQNHPCCHRNDSFCSHYHRGGWKHTKARSVPLDSLVGERRSCRNLMSLCVIRENTKELDRVKNIYSQNPQLAKDRTKQCTMLLVSNLAEPRWISVGCHVAMLDSVVCTNRTHINDTPTSPLISDSYCKKDEVRIDNICFHLFWIRNNFVNITSVEAVCVHLGMKPTTIIYPAMAKQIAEAADFKKMFLLSKMRSFENFIGAVFVEKDWLSMRLGKVKLSERCIVSGFLTCKRQTLRQSRQILMTTHPNLFRCESEKYISVSLRCKQQNYCSSEQNSHLNSDKSQCTCKNAGASCQNVCEKDVCRCSFLNYRSLSGVCKPYVRQQNDTHIEHHTSAHNKQSSNVALSNLSLKDTEYSRTLCRKQRQLFHMPHNPYCFNISDICVYKLQSDGKLTPCENGNHLHNCSAYTCNTNFKCFNSFCVPWSYTCDGKWDCSHGHDELTAQCGTSRPCKEMFQCKGCQICVHVQDVCDGKNDCPWGDDELMCELIGASCPVNCTCLSLAFLCKSVEVSFSDKSLSAYIAAHISNTTIDSISLFFPMVRAVVLHITCGRISNICFWRSALKKLLHLDFSCNLIGKLSASCFCSLQDLRILKLPHNHIKFVETEAFANLFKLNQVDMSNNELVSIPECAFAHASSLAYLVLYNNSFLFLDHDFFIGLRKTNIMTFNYRICCLSLAYGHKCSAAIPWHFSCHSLFSFPFFYVAAGISVFVLLSNGFAVSLQHITSDGPGHLFVAGMLSGHFLCGLSLMILWAAQVFFGDPFVQSELLWRQSVLCATTSVVVLIFKLSTLLYSCLLSLARLMVVLHPLDSLFKRKRNVYKLLFTFGAIVIVVSICFTSLMRSVVPDIPSVLCSPFIDPLNLSWLVTFVSFFILICDVVGFTSSLTAYILLLQSLRKSGENLNASKVTKLSPITIQVSVLSVSCCVSWIAPDVIHVSALLMSQYPVEMLEWSTVVLQPIGSIINPIVFIVLFLRS